MKKNRIVYVVFVIFLLVGIGLLTGAFFYGRYYVSFKAEAEEVTGEITRIEDYYDSDHELRHHVYVSYTYDGEDYDDVSINSYSSSMYKGKEIELLCDKKNPGHIMKKSDGNFVVIVLTGLGVVFALIGAIPLLVMTRKKSKNKKILETGQVLHALVDSIEYNTSVSVNGTHPYVIFCSYRDEYKEITYRFKSENIWTDPSLVFQPGSDVEVYVDPGDYSKYYVNAQKLIEQKVVDFT